MKINKGKLYLITGGSGFLGDELIKRIINFGGVVRVIARNEGKLIELKEKYPNIQIHTGDISDKFEVRQAFKGVTGVFHLAASKHVGLAETYCRECVKSNIIGSMNVLEQSLIEEPEFVIGISTDKAAQVSGVYGASKLLMERLFQQYERINEKTKYRVVRYGNVIYSTGSVLCKWRKLIKNNEEIIVTDPAATRFFWTVGEAVDLIFECLRDAKDSLPYVPDMKSMCLKDLLEAMKTKYLPDSAKGNLKIREIGLQKGENLHEKVVDGGPYSNEVENFTIEEILEKI